MTVQALITRIQDKLDLLDAGLAAIEAAGSDDCGLARELRVVGVDISDAVFSLDLPLDVLTREIPDEDR